MRIRVYRQGIVSIYSADNRFHFASVPTGHTPGKWGWVTLKKYGPDWDGEKVIFTTREAA